MKAIYHWPRLRLSLVGAVLTGLVAGGIALATIPGPDGVIHGCYLNKIGTLRIIDPSTQRCTRLETPIQWNQKGPAGGAGPQNVTVNCSAGQSVNQALSQTMGAPQVTITITGTCTEAVAINRDNVRLQAASPGDGITAPAGAHSALAVNGAEGIFLENLTLRGGKVGLSVGGGSAVMGPGLHVQGSETGVQITTASTGNFQQPTIDNAAVNGVSVTSGGIASIHGGTINGSGANGVFAQGNALVELWNGTVVTGSVSQGVFGSAGIAANDGATIEAQGVTVKNTADDGVKAFNGGSINLGGGSVIENNQRTGVNAMAAHVNLQGVNVRNNGTGSPGGGGVNGSWGSAIVLQGSTVIENNAGNGLELHTGSAAAVNGDVAIRNNAQDGIHIRDTSVANLDAANQITGNGNWGVFCEPSPSVAMITGSTPSPSGNGSGQLSCPS
jgi:hypothetical protein